MSLLPGAVGTLAPSGEQVVQGVLHDVGTYSSQTGVVGEKGFDVPTLLGLHATTPYLHDGSARILEEVLANEQHTRVALSEVERISLAVFLRSIDARTPLR